MPENTDKSKIIDINTHLVPIETIRPGILKLIKQKNPQVLESGYISLRELKEYRKEHFEEILKAEKGKLNKLDKEVLDSLVDQESIVKNTNEFDTNITFGQKLADKVAEFGGSWTFIIFFGCFLLIWIIINTFFLLTSKPFDPYPFILLNLFLSCLAAIQAPIIMMSQNRKEQKDRQRAENDYMVNLKSELEIRQLHEKMDNLVQHQWERLIEIQKLQLNIMDETEKERLKSEIKRIQKSLNNTK
ncbi:MAG TPA: DUF1003 domain-containing protein [archaeon]|nr:DUF1003 domain-containing protein [archaeon]